MPQPVYILASESGVVDSATNNVSHFNVLETLQLMLGPTEKIGKGKSKKTPLIAMIGGELKVQIAALWKREPNEAGQEFDAEFGFRRPEESDEKILQKTTFIFEKEKQRFIVNLSIMPRPDAKSGQFVFESRVRKAGTKNWIRQSYAIDVTVNQLPVPPKHERNGKKPK